MSLPQYFTDFKALFTGESLSRGGMFYAWAELGSALALAIAIPCGLLAALGLRFKPVLWLGILALAYVVFVPLPLQIIASLQEQAPGGLEVASRASAVEILIQDVLLNYGIMVALLATFSVAELVGLEADTEGGRA